VSKTSSPVLFVSLGGGGKEEEEKIMFCVFVDSTATNRDLNQGTPGT
jgi:hypothetical protein